MFWDSSALIPLILRETSSGSLTKRLAHEESIAIWWGTPVECLSAIHRRHREAPLEEVTLSDAISRLRVLTEYADAVVPTDSLRSHAGRLVAVHPLRAADALQLAAALAWCENRPRGEGLLTLDLQLRDAAVQEGFNVLP